MIPAAALLLALGGAPQQAAAPPRQEIHVQAGHVRIFKTLDVSADGRLVATSADGLTGDGTVKIWELATGRQLRSLSVRGGDVSSVILSPDHRLAASQKRYGEVQVWNVTTGQQLSAPGGGRGGEMAFTPDGRVLLLGLSAWDPQTGRRLFDVTPAAARNPTFEKWHATLSANGRLLAASSETGELRLFRMPAGTRLPTPAGARGPIALSANGALMAAKTLDGAIDVWDIATGRKISTSEPTESTPVRFDASNHEVIALFEPRRAPAIVSMISTSDGRVLRQLEVGDEYNCVNCSLTVSPNGKWLVRGGYGDIKGDAGLTVWNLEDLTRAPRAWSQLGLPNFTSAGNRLVAGFDGTRIWSIDLDSGAESCAAPAVGAGLLAAVWSSTPAWLATADLGGHVVAWDMKTGIPAPIPQTQVARAPALSFLASGAAPYMVVEGVSGFSMGGLSRNVNWLTPACPTPSQPQIADAARPGPWDSAALDSVRSGSAYPVALSSGGNWVVSNIHEHPWIRVSNARTGEHLGTLDDAPDGSDRDGVVTALAARRSGDELASSTTISPVISIWNPKTWKRVRSLRGHDERVTALAYDEVSGQLASAGWDKTLRLWNSATGRELEKWQLPGAPSSIAFSPDGQRLVVIIGAEILEIRRGRRERRVFAGQETDAAAVSYSPDGRLLAAASVDGSTNLWDVATGRRLATLISFARGEEWLVVTPDGYFDGSPSAWRQILWRYNHNAFDVVPVETYYREFYRQGLLAAVIAGGPPPARVALAQIDRRLPALTISAAPGATNRTTSIHIDVREAPADRTHPRGSGVRDVRLFRNGALVHVWHGDIALDGKGHQSLAPVDVAVVSGDNIFSAYAFNRANIKSQDAEVFVTGSSSLNRQGTAWVVSIGIESYLPPGSRLNVAVDDAAEFGKKFVDAQRALGKYTPQLVSLTNRTASKSNIMLALDVLSGRRALPEDADPALKSLRRAEPEDAVVIFFAGHGTADGARFYLMPQDVAFIGSRDELAPSEFRTMVSGSISDQDLSRAMESIDARDIVLLIDACRSGQVVAADDPRQGPLNSPGFAQLAYEKGMNILTAAQAFQPANEAPAVAGARPHGLLTQALLDGLTTPAPEGKSIRQWLDEAVAAVPRLHRAAQLAIERPITEDQVQRPRVFYRRFPERIPFVVVPGIRK
jgi:WD40 repeat protein